MTVAALLPHVFPQFLDENGDPYAGGSLTFSQSGTDTPFNVYSDSGLSTSLGNVITLSAAGRPTSNGTTLVHIFLYTGAYRVKLKDSGGATIWSVDSIYDMVALVNMFAAASIQTSSATGTQNDFVLTGSAYTPHILRFYNASTLTITGFAGLAVDGQRLTVIAAGVGTVGIVHQSSSSQPANRCINIATSVTTALIGGYGTAEFIYDGTASRWRMFTHEFGGTTLYAPTWSAPTPPAIGNGSLVAGFSIRGRKVSVNITLSAGSTTTYGTGAWTFTLPTSADVSAFRNGTVSIVDAGTGLFMAIPTLITSSTISIAMGDGTANYVGSAVPMTWANTDSLFLAFDYAIA